MFAAVAETSRGDRFLPVLAGAEKRAPRRPTIARLMRQVRRAQPRVRPARSESNREAAQALLRAACFPLRLPHASYLRRQAVSSPVRRESELPRRSAGCVPVRLGTRSVRARVARAPLASARGDASP